jgi:alginate O-acetyltransferase complex protein AlgI
VPIDPLFWAAVLLGPGVYWCLPTRLRAGFLTALSFAYLCTLDWQSAAALAIFSLVFFYVAPRAVGAGTRGQRIVAGLILLITGYLLFFKYVPPLWRALAPDSSGLSLVLPLGISFFTFKLIHYAVEAGRGRVTDRSLPTFLSYIYLFPTFTAGPIERYDHFLANREDALTREAVAQGLTRILHGLVKKFVLAEFVVRQVLMEGQTTAELVAADMGTRDAWGFLASALLYAYFDFAGYSDLAIGASRLFGLRIMENFDWPLTAPNISAFWKRWHMTLAGWCQAYVYMPMIGLTRNPYLSIYATFVVMGLWHAGNLNYLGWGLYHATGVSVALTWARFLRKRGFAAVRQGPRTWWGVAVTMLFVCGSFAFSATNGLGIRAALRVAGAALGVDVGELQAE